MNSATVNKASPRRRMTRKEIWTQIGLSVAGWVMFVAIVRIWWRVYLAGERFLGN